MQLLPEVCQFLPMYFHGLMHMWLVGEPQQTTPQFSMFYYRRELDNFTRA